jgi:antitoxin HicB
MKETGIFKSELARKMGIHEKMVRRILNPHHGTKLSTMERTLFALGKHAELHVT